MTLMMVVKGISASCLVVGSIGALLLFLHFMLRTVPVILRRKDGKLVIVGHTIFGWVSTDKYLNREGDYVSLISFTERHCAYDNADQVQRALHELNPPPVVSAKDEKVTLEQLKTEELIDD